MIQKHCFECGTALIEKELEEEGIVPYCPKCQQYRFPMYNVAVSMIVVDEETGKILLIQQYGKPSYILVAGYVNRGEAEEHAVVREVREETGLTLTSYTFRGLITFISDQQETELMCLFTADGFEGKPGACNEGELAWIPKTEVSALPTWEGDAVFLEILLRDDPRFFTLRLAYEGDKLVDKKLQFYTACTGTEETV